MRRFWRQTTKAAFLSVLLALGAPVVADEIQVELAPPPLPFLLHRPLMAADSTALDMVLEASAVEPIGDGRLLLVADDKVNGLMVVEAATGLRVGPPLTSTAFPSEGAKWEAMARDDAGAYYLIGSHSGRPSELAAHSYLLRFRLKGGGADGAALAIDESSVTRFDIAEALAREGLYNLADPTKNRVKIEGLAVRSVAAGVAAAGQQLVIGLREPDTPITAYAAQIPSGTTGTGAPQRLALRKLFTFPAGTRESVRSQLSSLEYVPGWQGFLIVTSSEDNDNKYHGNTLWFKPDGQSAPRKIAVFGVGIKAEGLCLLGTETVQGYAVARIALVYDNDAARTKAPSLIQMLTLVRWP